MEETMVDEVIEQPVEQAESTESQETQETQQEDPYSSKASREYSQWLKSLRDSGDPTAAKFARLAKDNHGAMYALKQMFPNGIDGVRESKALLDSVIHNDPERGELKGAEAIAALQDTVREYAETDELLAQGDPRALDTLGEEFNEGLAKLAPAILERIQQSNPDAYAAAVLPHFVKALAQSDLVSNFNGLVDVLNEQPPNWLTPDQKTAWGKDQMQKVIALAGNMGKWLNAQAEKAGTLPKDGVPRGTKPDPIAEREKQFNQREQDHHWNTNISPKLDQHASQTFLKLFQSYAKRLNLDGPTTNALKMEFSKRVAQTAAKDQAYMGQIKRYRAMRNPDPSTVLNYAKVEFDKHAKTVMDSLVNERYKPFLNGKPRAQTNGNGAKLGTKPAGPGVQIVTTKPANIDYKRTPLNWLHEKKYYTMDGKVVQVRA